MSNTYLKKLIETCASCNVKSIKINGENVPEDVDYAVAEEAEEEFTEQLSFSFKQEQCLTFTPVFVIIIDNATKNL